MTDPPIHFNLWSDPWIRVTPLDGPPAELSIGACLAEAHTLAALHDPSPLVVAGIHRLLAAVLQAIYNPGSLDDIEALLAAAHFDPARLETFAARHADRFDLFHPTAPFLQTGDVPLDGWRKPEKGQKHDWADPKPVAALLAEIPVETYRAHFHNVTDASHQICPSCCGRGLVTIPPFASAGGRPYHPSINGIPPLYVLPAGSTLFESLALSLIVPDYQPATRDHGRSDIAAWTGSSSIAKNTSVSTVSYLESLTFPARRVRLYPHAEPTTCTHCGARTQIIVGDLLFEMGHWPSEGLGVWEDPFVAFRQPGGRGKREASGLVPIRPQEGKAIWREYTGLLLLDREGQLRPKVVRQLGNLVDRAALNQARVVRFRCIGLRTDKAKIFEWLDEALEAPPTLLDDPDGALRVETAIQRASEAERTIGDVFNRHFRPKRDQAGRDDKRVRFKTLRARMLANYWQLLAPEFRDLVFALADVAGRDAAERMWADTVVKTGRQAFDAATEQIGARADALRMRVQAQAECRRFLAAKRKGWFGE